MKECDPTKPTETKTLFLCFQTGDSFRKTVRRRSAVTERESREEGEEEKREGEDMNTNMEARGDNERGGYGGRREST